MSSLSIGQTFICFTAGTTVTSIPVGSKMVLYHKEGRAMPKLFSENSAHWEGLKQMIADMCSFQDVDRPPLDIIKEKVGRFKGRFKNILQLVYITN